MILIKKGLREVSSAYKKELFGHIYARRSRLPLDRGMGLRSSLSL